MKGAVVLGPRKSPIGAGLQRPRAERGPGVDRRARGRTRAAGRRSRGSARRDAIAARLRRDDRSGGPRAPLHAAAERRCRSRRSLPTGQALRKKLRGLEDATEGRLGCSVV